MQKGLITGMFLAVSTLSVAHAQYADPANQPANPANPGTTSSQLAPVAPVVRAYPDAAATATGSRASASPMFDSRPTYGVFVRNDVANGVEVVSSSNAVTELRVLQGRADVTIHHPAEHSEILVDLRGGQVSLLKDGVYTFNAETKIVRVLHGEAEAFGGAQNAAKGTKVKEFQQLAFYGDAKPRAVNSYTYELTADLLPGGAQGREDGVGDGPYRRGFYGDYPLYAGGYGYPYGYGYGYPFGVGLGFGYYGGFGGFRGGFRR